MTDNTSGKGLEALSDAVTAAMSSPDKAGSKPAKALGCKCRKSHCLKHYCECFHNGLKCGPHCKCVRKKCENGNGKPKKESSSSRSKSGKSKSSSSEGVSAPPAAPPADNTMMPPPPLPQQQQQQPAMAMAMDNNTTGAGAGTGAVGFQSFPGQAPSIATATVQYPGFNAPQQSPQGMMGMPQIGGVTMALPQFQPQPPQNNFAPQGNAMAGFPNANNNMQFYLQQLQIAQQNAGGFSLPQQQQPQQALNFGGQFAPQQMTGYGQQAPNVANMASLPQQQPMMQFPTNPQQQQPPQATAQPAGGDTKTTGGSSTNQAQPPVAPDGSNASNAAAAASGQSNAAGVGGEAPEAALLLLRANTQNPLILAEKILGPRPSSKDKSKLNAWNYQYKKMMKTGYEEVRKELQNNRRHQNRIRDKLSKEEQRLAEMGKSMDAKDRKKYDDMLHELEEKKMALEEKRKKINENEKVWQRECRELKKMQFWSKPGVPGQGGAAGTWNPAQQLPLGPPPSAAQGSPPPQLDGGDTKPAASKMVDDDAKNAADYAVAQAEAALAAASSSAAKTKKGDSGGSKESKKRKSSSSRSSSRSKRKSRTAEVEADIGDTAAV